MRLFIAIEPTEEIRQKIQEVVDGLSQKHKNQRFIGTNNLHFTLKFLGDVQESQLGALEQEITRSVRGMKPFSLHVSGMGHFGSRKFARTIWIGSREGSESFVGLAKSLEAGLASFKKGDMPPKPHITLCRPDGNTTSLMEDIDALKEHDFGTMEVRSVHLKSSILARGGAIYSDVKAFSL
jgi:RNA 2',3'-cyclic 3'-phosphodiesterase